MKNIIKGAVMLSALFMPASPALAQNASACNLPPILVSPLETGPFIVSTYHTTGVPGTDRVIQVQWPRAHENPLSGVPPGRTDGATRTLLFELPGGEVSIPNEYGQMMNVTFPKFDVFVGGGVDRYPLYSKLGHIGGIPSTGGRELLHSDSGHTYHSSEGFETFPDEDHGNWTRYTYANANVFAYEKDTFFRGTPKIGGVEAILSCSRWADGPVKYSQCQISKKLEPVFYRSTFRGRDIADLPVIEYVADRLMECILGEL